MKRLFLAACLTGALGVLGVTAASAGAFTVHPLNSSAKAALSHRSKRGHRLSAAQLRKDKKIALSIVSAVKSHKAHAAQDQYLYAGSVWSDPMDPYYLADDATDSVNAGCDDIAPEGADYYPECYAYNDSDSGVNDACSLITSYTFTYGLYSCVYLRQDYYEDVNTHNYYAFQLICGTYYAGQESDPASYGCDYTGTYSLDTPDTESIYGLFSY